MRRGGNLAGMEDNRRSDEQRDRRAHPRAGRRSNDQQKPWYRRRRLWLAVASFAFMGWRRATRRPVTSGKADSAAA